MKLLVGAVAYLAVVAAVVAAVFMGLPSIGHQRPQEPTVLAKGTDGRAGEWERAREESVQADPNRVPVWIVPTAKYHYTPVPADQGPKRTRVIGGDARGAMAKAPRNTRGQVLRGETERAGPSSPGLGSSRRDNDPFFRD
jgi:hypothetical protein